MGKPRRCDFCLVQIASAGPAWDINRVGDVQARSDGNDQHVVPEVSRADEAQTDTVKDEASVEVDTSAAEEPTVKPVDLSKLDPKVAERIHLLRRIGADDEANKLLAEAQAQLSAIDNATKQAE